VIDIWLREVADVSWKLVPTSGLSYLYLLI
jgi:hypothetical protein